jgi:hypothetical protein
MFYIVQITPLIRRLEADFPPRRPGFNLGSSHLGFVVGKVALRPVFYEYFLSPTNHSFHRLLHNDLHLSSRAGIVGQELASAKLDRVQIQPNK